MISFVRYLMRDHDLFRPSSLYPTKAAKDSIEYSPCQQATINLCVLKTLSKSCKIRNPMQYGKVHQCIQCMLTISMCMLQALNKKEHKGCERPRPQHGGAGPLQCRAEGRGKVRATTSRRLPACHAAQLRHEIRQYPYGSSSPS